MTTPRIPQRMIFDGLNCYPLNTFPDWAVKKEGWQYVTVTAESTPASTGEGRSPEGETPETDEMTRLYREQVAPVLDTLAAGACTRILNKMGQIERERDEALRKTLIAVNRAHDAQAQLIPTLLRAEAAEAEVQAWKSQFGASQLTHAIARLEAAENLAQRALRSIPAAGANTGEAILAPLREFRDTILHERGALEGEWFGTDRVNAVLSEFDDAMQAVEAVIATPPKETTT